MGKTNKIPTKILGIFGSYLFIMLLTFIIKRNITIDDIHQSVFLYVGAIGIVVAVSSLIHVNINDDDFEKHISLTFAFIGISNIIYVILSRIQIEKNMLMATTILFMSCILEVCFLLYSFKYTRSKLNIKNNIIMRLFLLLVVVYISSTLGFGYEEFNNINYKIIDLNNKIEYVYLIMFLLYIYTLYKSKDKVANRVKIDLIRYSILKVSITILIKVNKFMVNYLDITTYENVFYIIIYILMLLTSYYMISICIHHIIKKSNETLYTYLLEEKIKLNETLNSLKIKESREESRNEVLSNISHELKTPITIIYSSVQMQDLSIKNNNLEEMIKFNGIIRQNCNRLIRLINNFIDSTKFETRNSTVELKYVNIVSLVEYITMSVLPFAQNKNIEITFDTQEEEFFCEIDIDFVERIMLNILSNAIKYNKENGSIYVYISKLENFINISIKDTGIGIPKNKIESVFDRFDRANKSRIKQTEGAGIGLNIVKHMVSLLNGEIFISSKENIGTTVDIQLPKCEKYDNEEYIEFNSLGQSLEVELSNI